MVEGPALHRLNVWLHEHGEFLAVQVHAHPGEAYHSDTDNTYPIVTENGALSIVVPYFGAAGIRGGGTAAYRLVRGRWRELTEFEWTRLVEYR